MAIQRLNGATKWVTLAIAIVVTAVGYGEVRLQVADNCKEIAALRSRQTGIADDVAWIRGYLEKQK
ncbi:MAG TPA: hypothetical protein VMZ31_12615 [Phycisphaerae bacterium]|nr:hypothetical protein [Phycisphaerae bacterium]